MELFSCPAVCEFRTYRPAFFQGEMYDSLFMNNQKNHISLKKKYRPRCHAYETAMTEYNTVHIYILVCLACTMCTMYMYLYFVFYSAHVLREIE